MENPHPLAIYTGSLTSPATPCSLTSFAGGVGCVVSDRRAVMTNPSAASALDFVDAPASSKPRCCAGDRACVRTLAVPSAQSKATNSSTRLSANSLSPRRREEGGNSMRQNRFWLAVGGFLRLALVSWRTVCLVCVFFAVEAIGSAAQTLTTLWTSGSRRPRRQP